MRAVNVRCIQIGGATEVVIDGDDLAGARLLFPFPVKQELKQGSTDKRATIAVSVAKDVEPGFGHLRVVTDGGISAPVVFAIDGLVSLPLAPAVKELPVALHGVVAGPAVVETKFPGKAKQKVIVEVESQRLGGKLRPIVHLLGPDKLQLTWGWAAPSLQGDARLEAILPSDGIYTVTLHDQEYAAPANSFFRLKIGDWSFADRVFPPVVSKGKGQKVELLGMDKPVAVDLPAPSSLDVMPLAFPKGGLWSGPRPFVRVSAHAEIVEQAAPGQAQELPAGLVGVSGRLLTPYEEDGYRVPVTPGKKVRFEVFAERYGFAIDTALVVRDEKGAVLARGDDSPGSLDPILEYTVPDKVVALVVGVVDAQGRGGPRAVYRLVVEPQGLAAAASDDYVLFTPTERIVLPVGGRSVLPVLVDRRGYQGKIDLVSVGVPAGVRLEGTTIPEEAEGTLITIHREGDAQAPGLTSWRGKSSTGDERTVLIKGHPLERLQPWLAAELAFAPSYIKAADFQIDWRDLPSDAGLVPGRKLALPVKVTRANAKAPVKLTIITSQPTPLLNAKPDVNRQLRQDKAVDLNAGASDGEVTLVVPPQLAALEYDVTIQAEFLSDKKTVEAVTFAPVRRLMVKQVIVVELAGPNRIDVPLNPKTGATVTLKGKIDRREGLKGEVVLALTGLPGALKVAPVTVKAEAGDFALSFALPPTTPAGEIKGVKLSGSAAADPKQPNVRVRGRDVELTLVVK